MKDPIFILGCHKSGTSLLRSLLDGHEDLQCIPIESHIFEHNDFASNNSLRYKSPSTRGREHFINSVNDLLNNYHTNGSNYADSNFNGLLNLNKSQKIIKGQKKNNDNKKNILLAFKAILSAFDIEIIKEKTLVEKSVENHQFAAYLDILFPKSKFIHILRNPYDNLSSLIKYKQSEAYPSLIELVQVIKSSYFYAYNNNKVIKNYKIIKYEDLTTDTTVTMKDIASFLDIPFTNDLINPTSLGKAWKGNSTKNKKFKFATKNSNAKLQNLEIEYINIYLENFMKLWNYNKINKKYNLILPIRKEKFKTYLRNRAGLLFNNII